ncbi:MAG: hypothetical protein AVDCRST_MAG68-4459 [uncultured Gemmatimonadetes bacterium]|uniref:Amidohydrolase-related domain-containing protein n=1 Tax=uncultured Gemmatimonadota bacterium TaxID=203437 RepID=A0A6J4MCD3_9BACT|nr:MAG: hypothetical protein AVDCRST_MAG68-4459 [uncultured Gemmatimonadota bacterium]
MIVDCHTHLNRYLPEQPPSLHERYAQLRAEMDANGIDYSLVLSSYKVNEDRPSTAEIVRLVHDDARIGVAAGISFYALSTETLAELRALLETGRVRALKLYPGYQAFYVYDPQLRGVYGLAAEFGVPVMIHTGDTYDRLGKLKYTHPLTIDEAAVDFRDVHFVICHMGNPWLMDAAEVIYKNENVSGDISGFTLGTFEERFERLMIAKMRDVIAYANGTGGLLYGTDWPISDMASYLRFVEKLELSGEEAENLLWKNASTLFRLGLGGGDGDL